MDATITQPDGTRAVTLGSVVRPSVAVVIGATGGIGRALTEALVPAGFGAVHALSRSGEAVAGVAGGHIDLLDETSIAAAAAEIGGNIGLLIVAAGMLHDEGVAPEKSWRMIDRQSFAHVLAVNTIGPALIAKHFLPRLANGRTVFAALSARVGSVSDNRLGGWHAYRASKAALNMLIANFAIELRTRKPEALAIGLHPGTVDTHLSAPFQRNVAADKLFTPAYSAEKLLSVIDKLTPADSGGCFAWDGARIAP